MQLEALRMAYDEIKKGENTQLFREVVQKIDGRLGPNYGPDDAFCEAVDRRAEQRKEKLENELNAYRSGIFIHCWMADNKEREVNTSRGNGWEVVSLMASAYAAAPGPKQVELNDDDKEKLDGEDKGETSQALFMSHHFNFPPSQPENLPLEPENTEIYNELSGVDAAELEIYNEPSGEDASAELVAEEGGGSDVKDDVNLKTKDLTDDFMGIQLFDEKCEKLSISGTKFDKGMDLERLNLADKEQSIHNTMDFSTFNSKATMIIHTSSSSPVIHTLFFLFILFNAGLFRFADGGKRKIHITDDLADVVDDEEDEGWKEWGKKPSPKFDAPPKDLSKMEFSEMQAEMLKYQVGPAFGFVKLRLGTRRTPDMIMKIAEKWTKLAKTGSIEVLFMGVDISTIMFNLEKGQDSLELKDFILTQPEAYEVKIGDEFFRRPGDPPFDEVFQKFRAEKTEGDPINSMKGYSNKKDEF